MPAVGAHERAHRRRRRAQSTRRRLGRAARTPGPMGPHPGYRGGNGPPAVPTLAPDAPADGRDAAGLRAQRRRWAARLATPGRGTRTAARRPAPRARGDQRARGLLALHVAAYRGATTPSHRAIYPLGSCTMKYNPKVNEQLAGARRLRRAPPLPGRGRRAGHAGAACRSSTASGAITGMARMSLQPAAGAHGRVDRAAHDPGLPRRPRRHAAATRVLIPDSRARHQPRLGGARAGSRW